MMFDTFANRGRLFAGTRISRESRAERIASGHQNRAGHDIIRDGGGIG